MEITMNCTAPFRPAQEVDKSLEFSKGYNEGYKDAIQDLHLMLAELVSRYVDTHNRWKK